MRLRLAVLLGSITTCRLFGQPYTISTLAGGGLPVNIPGASAVLGSVSKVAVDPSGNAFLACGDYSIVLRLDAKTGLLTLIAGNGVPGFSGDNGLAVDAQLNFLYGTLGGGLAVDSAGNLYIADYGNGRIRKVANGIITTVAGNGTSVLSGDNG